MKYELLESNFNSIYNNPIETILMNRGIPPQNIQHYLYTTDDDIIDPELLMNIKDGAEMLLRHIINGSEIYIQVDCDCDGYTSSAILINYLYKLFPSQVLNNITYGIHEDKMHGVELSKVPENCKLVIIPDAGSNQFEEHFALNQGGKDVLVLDHHQASTISPYACIINNQLCDYPTKSLSGAGIVYKFCCYLDKILEVNFAPT